MSQPTTQTRPLRLLTASGLAMAMLIALIIPAMAQEREEPTDSVPGDTGPVHNGQLLTEAEIAELQASDQAAIRTEDTTYDPTTLTKFIPSSAFENFHSNGDDDFTNQTSICLSRSSANTTTAWAYAPVELPDGARIISYQVYGRDDNATNDFFAVLSENRVSLPGVVGGTANTSTGFDTIVDSSGLSGIGSVFHDVDPDWTVGSTGSFLSGTTNRFTKIRISFPPDAAGLEVCGVAVYYQVPATGDNLTFTSIEPCPLFDSRPSKGGTGKFAANETRNNLPVTGDLTTQGGAADCGIPFSVASIQTNLLVLDPTGNGSLKTWQGGEPEPDEGSVLAYASSPIRWNNSAVIPVNHPSGGQFSPAPTMSLLTKGNGAHVRVVATGYYSPVSNMGN